MPNPGNKKQTLPTPLSQLSPADRLIVALDFPDAHSALALAGVVGQAASAFKVGKELFTAEGPKVVNDLVAAGRRVFLDLKFHDIPATVSGAVSSAARLGVSMLTVHASGGRAMLEAAVKARGNRSESPIILAVTVLTSLKDSDLSELGIHGSVTEQVLRLARLAKSAGCGGVVASPQEAAVLRKELGPDFLIVTAGVRPAGGTAGDQARVATPAQAIAAGASHIVVGRPITASKNPAAAARAIVEEIAGVV
ncbi:MAG: orotidine-5'-phosphate decarboxylase [Terriglobales bacterium]